MEKELLESKEYLENIISKPVVTMSFPHGSYNSEIISKLNSLGYEYAVNSWFKTNTAEDENLSLGRIVIMKRDDMNTFKSKAYGYYDCIPTCRKLKDNLSLTFLLI